jgi:signal transduction histidine kinase
MAERIEDMIAELRKKEEFQRQLIANVSHDLRTPMASVRGYVETMLMDCGRTTTAEKERFLNIIAGNLDHLERLVDHMLILSRFDSGQATFRMENFPPAELADATLVRCEGLAAERDVKLELEVGDGIALVHADPLQIAQVLQNLVENAIKFNRPGGRVAIRIKREGNRVRIEVRDTGYGIDAADLPRIFDRFYTGDQSRTRVDADPHQPLKGHHLSQNSGLGLAIAAKIVAGHDSVLHVDSRPGQGSVFYFSLHHVEEDRQDAAAD